MASIGKIVQHSLASLKTASRLQCLALTVPGLHVSWRQQQGFCSTTNRQKELNSSWYVYGVVLPINANKNYEVVKIGRSQKYQVAKRLYNIHNKFSRKYGLSIFENPPQQGAETEAIIDRTRRSSDDELFLLSEIAGTENDSNFAEREARDVLGVKQLNFDPAINLEASKEMEWTLVPRSVIGKIREAQRNGEMDHFNNTKDFVEKLRCCTNKRYLNMDVLIGETRMSTGVPEYYERPAKQFITIIIII